MLLPASSDDVDAEEMRTDVHENGEGLAEMRTKSSRLVYRLPEKVSIEIHCDCYYSRCHLGQHTKNSGKICSMYTKHMKTDVPRRCM